MSIRDRLAGIAETIHNATGLRSFGYVPPSINPPTCAVTLGEDVPGAFEEGANDRTIIVWVFVSKADDRSGQLAMYDYLDATGGPSVRHALADEPGLSWQRTRPLSFEEIAAIGYFGVAFEYLEYTSGS